MRLYDWKMMPIRSRRRRRSSTSTRPSSQATRPSTTTRPRVGGSISDRARRRVVFPDPLGPIRATSSPASTAIETSFSATTSVSPRPKTFVTCSPRIVDIIRRRRAPWSDRTRSAFEMPSRLARTQITSDDAQQDVLVGRHDDDPPREVLVGVADEDGAECEAEQTEGEGLLQDERGDRPVRVRRRPSGWRCRGSSRASSCR